MNIFSGREDERRCHCNNCGAKFNDSPSARKSPCPACPMEYDCYNENTDKRHECQAFIKFQEEQEIGEYDNPNEAAGFHRCGARMSSLKIN